jgi:hypothetical protein
VVVSNHVENLLDRQADIALRHTDINQNGLIARPIGQLDLGAYAHADYLARVGGSIDLSRLDRYHWIGYDTSDALLRGFRDAQAGADRRPNAPLLPRADGQAWTKDLWKNSLKEAARSAGLPVGTTAYTLRHSVITDLVHDGLDLLTVAQLSGTSVAMIEKHYGHLRSDVAAGALARLSL